MFDSGPSLVQEKSDFLDPAHGGVHTARRGEANFLFLSGAFVHVPREPCDCVWTINSFYSLFCFSWSVVEAAGLRMMLFLHSCCRFLIAETMPQNKPLLLRISFPSYPD